MIRDNAVTYFQLFLRLRMCDDLFIIHYHPRVLV